MLTVHRISKTYSIQTILAEVNLNLNPGERLALVGPNGCGKTTLLRTIAGFASQIWQVEQGRIRAATQ